MPIERLGPQDWRRAREVRVRALRDAPDAFGSTVEGETAQPPERWRDHVAKPGAATWVATVDGADVGMIVGDRYEDGAAGLFGMWVAPEVRGTGVADRLVDAHVTWARAQGHARILLDVGDENVAAVRLYERKGFLPTGVTGVVAPDRPHIREHQRALELH